MDPLLKLVFTIISVLAAVVICLIDPQGDNAGPDSLWRLGKRDPIRNLICKPDGTFRRFTKAGILLWFAACLAILWLKF